MVMGDCHLPKRSAFSVTTVPAESKCESSTRFPTAVRPDAVYWMVPETNALP